MSFMDKIKSKDFWMKRIGNSDKGTSDYVNPYVSWGSFGGTLAVAIVLGLIICL